MTTKPTNKFALTLWIVAVIFVLADVPTVVALKSAIMNSRYPVGVQMPILWSNVWVELRSALLGAMQLAGIGVLIEIADQIRWKLSAGPD